MRVEMGKGQRVNDGLLEFVDDLAKAAYVGEGHVDVLWVDDFHGNGLFVGSEHQIFAPSGSASARGMAIWVGREAGGVESPENGGGFCCSQAFFVGFRIHTCHDIFHQIVC